MIKMNTAIAGADFSIASGEVTDRFDAATEKRLIDSGQAEAVKQEVKKTKKTSKK